MQLCPEALMSACPLQSPQSSQGNVGLVLGAAAHCVGRAQPSLPLVGVSGCCVPARPAGELWSSVGRRSKW